jgi:hypothetical protein
LTAEGQCGTLDSVAAKQQHKQTKGYTMQILHNGVICGHYDFPHDNKHVCEVSDDNGDITFVAIAWMRETFSTGVRRKMMQIETSDGMLTLDEEGAHCLISSLKRLLECDIQLSND